MEGVRLFDQGLFDDLLGRAAVSPRRRQHHNFHAMEEGCHRLAVGLQPDTYIAPHRHLSADKAEALLLLSGRCGLLVFCAEGRLRERHLLEAGGSCVGADLLPGTFHALVALEPSILFECKAGPYRALGEGERAPWAPGEGEPGADAYLAWMREQFDR